MKGLTSNAAKFNQFRTVLVQNKPKGHTSGIYILKLTMSITSLLAKRYLGLWLNYHMPRNVTCKAHMWESHQRKRCTKDALPFQWSIFLPLQCCTCLVVLLNALHGCNYEALPHRSILSHNARRPTDASTDDADPDGSVPAPFNPTIPSLKTWSKQLNSRQRTTYTFTPNLFFLGSVP